MVESDVEHLQSAIIRAYEAACPLKKAKDGTKVPWWSGELDKLRSSSRKLLNRALKTKQAPDWAAYKAVQREYKKLIRKSKDDAWRGFCDETEALPLVAKLRRLFSSGPPIRLDGLTLPDGSMTESHTDILTHMLETHFPGSTPMAQGPLARAGPGRGGERADWRTAGEIVTRDKIRWAIDTFDGFKSPGVDGIFPALLKEGGEILVACLCPIFRACLALCYIPKIWREVRVVFIPKPGKGHYDRAKSWRPISLMSFLLKTLERLVDRHIRDGALTNRPLSQSQHAYQAGRSTETALHHLVREVEGPLRRKNAALCVFMDVEGAFDNTSFDAICEAAARFGINATVVGWIRQMLQTRIVTASLGGTEVRALVGRGCPQGGVLSPLLWTLVVDGLLTGLDELRVTAVGYADDVALVVAGDHMPYMTSRMQRALDLVQQWCTAQALRINPSKTEMVMFTRKQRLEVGHLEIFGTRLALSTGVRYLGVTLDSKLSWKAHVTKQAQKATATYWACRRMVGQTWGLKPRVVRWIYTAILLPQLSYASLVWWPAMDKSTLRKSFDKVYRMAGLGITGALRTTTTVAMGALLDMPPPFITVEAEAWKAALRLWHLGHWFRNGVGHTVILHRIGVPLTVMQQGGDRCPNKYHFSHTFRVEYPSRQSWAEDPGRLLAPQGLIWYTDGSKTDDGAGVGIWCEGPRKSISLALGPTVSVLQAEVFAIKTCARTILDRGYDGKHIYICSDSRAALRSLQSCIINSVLVAECVELLTQIARDNRVKLLWVPGHSGIRGNELAHNLARAGASRRTCDEGCVIGIPPGYAKNQARERAANLFAALWAEAPGMGHTRSLFRGPSHKLGATVSNLDRAELRILTGLITGHWYTGKHLEHMGLGNGPICTRCGEAEETPLHLITRCRGLVGPRTEALGSNFTGVETIEEIGVGRLLHFARLADLTSFPTQ